MLRAARLASRGRRDTRLLIRDRARGKSSGRGEEEDWGLPCQGGEEEEFSAAFSVLLSDEWGSSSRETLPLSGPSGDPLRVPRGKDTVARGVTGDRASRSWPGAISGSRPSARGRVISAVLCRSPRVGVSLSGVSDRVGPGRGEVDCVVRCFLLPP